jgi:ZIP family zinc transporter
MQTASPILLAFVAGLVLWAMTALGAATVFLHRDPSRRALDIALGFTAGVMLAASYWSLLAPAVESARSTGNAWMAPTIGFLAGGLSLWALDRFLPHLHPGLRIEQAEGVKTPWQRVTLLMLAVTFHHIPEGLALGVAFGAAATGTSVTTVGAAVALAVGLGVQNVPEGIAIAASMRREGYSARQSFAYGQASAIVEPIAAVIGAALVASVAALMPYALGFAAGAMIFVVIEQLVPECQSCGDTDAPTIGALLGFALMMVLDIILG